MTDAEGKSQVGWVRRLNGRWIVHHGLGQHAEDYLEHLTRSNSDRLERSCQLAYQLAHQAGSDDPKPWFYAGLFSLATVEEARE